MRVERRGERVIAARAAIDGEERGRGRLRAD